MNFDKKEIVLFLELYSISKVKKKELDYTDVKDNNYMFYSFIIEHVEQWFTFLEYDELEIIKDKHLKNLTFDQISINNHYANHSSIVRKYKSIINKIKQYSSN